MQQTIERFLDEHPGPIRVLSSCSGDGRDLLEVLAGRTDADRVTATLIELHPPLADKTRAASAAKTTANVEVRTEDAGTTDSYKDAVPADLVILVGIFGNVSDDDIERLITTTPQFCGQRATVIWTRGRDPEDRNDFVRATFRGAGFEEIDYVTNDVDSLPAIGVAQYEGRPELLIEGRRLFTFLR